MAAASILPRPIAFIDLIRADDGAGIDTDLKAA